jgi:O-antigen/teichoic acid export membrane protein
MNVVNKVVFNMVTVYFKIIVTMFISLYSVPIVLDSLGASDFGLYNLVSGVILMLTFLNGSMTVSTQRFISIGMGVNDMEKINQLFNIGLLLHLVVGVTIVLILEISSYYIFNGFLNINNNRIYAAKIIFQCLIFSTFFTVISVPYDAVINAHEDFLPLSIIEIINSILIFIVALMLTIVKSDKLIFYGLALAIISFFIAATKWIFCSRKYAVCRFNFNKYNKDIFRKMFSFAGWNTFGAIAMMARNQGIAVVMNLFCGTIVNAAYGIANQINNVLSNFSITLQKSINPQLMISEGQENRIRMLNIAFISSKFSVYILCFFAIPLIIEMKYVLQLWLKNVPDNTIIFSQLILGLSIMYQFSVGLMSAIQSGGRIKNYQLSISALLILNLPISYLLLKNGYPIYSVLICLIVFEFISLVVRVLFAKNLISLNVRKFSREVLFSSFIIMIIAVLFSILPSQILDESFLRLMLTILLCIISIIIGVWFFGLNRLEKELITKIFANISNKIKR